MKYLSSVRVILFSLLTLAAGSVEPRTIDQAYAEKAIGMGAKRPGLQFTLLATAAQTDAQDPGIQNFVAQMVQNSFNTFESMNPRDQKHTFNGYKRLLNTNLLSAAQKTYLQNSIITPLEPRMSQIHLQDPAWKVAAENVETQKMIEQLGGVVPTPTVPAQAAPGEIAKSLATPIAPTAPAPETPVLVTQPLAPVAPAPATPGLELLQRQPVADMVNRPVGGVLPPVATQPAVSAPQTVPPVPTAIPAVAVQTAQATPVLHEAAVTAITQNPQTTTADKAAALTNLINTTPANIPVDAKTSSAIALAVQDIFNAQSAPTDAPHVANLLAAATQKPVLSQDQSRYVQSTLVPAVAQQLTVAPAPVATQPAVVQAVQPFAIPAQPVAVAGAPLTTAAVAMPVSTIPAAPVAPAATATVLSVPSSIPTAPVAQATYAQVPVATQAAQPSFAAATVNNLEENIKALYSQMQDAQGRTFDAQTQGAFGAKLVETFNDVVEIQSYMNQLLAVAQETPLLNDAQHQYVRDAMIPNLDQVSDKEPAKTLDQAVAETTPVAPGKAKKPALATEAAKKKKTKKGKKVKDGAAKKEIVATDAAEAKQDVSEPVAKKKGKKKKTKKTETAESAAPSDVTATSVQDAGQVAPEVGTQTAEKKAVGKKKRKKLKKAKKVAAETATATAGEVVG